MQKLTDLRRITRKLWPQRHRKRNASKVNLEPRKQLGRKRLIMRTHNLLKSKSATVLLLLALSVSVTGCETTSNITPTVSNPPKIPSMPAGIEPGNLGTYWVKVCNFRKNLQETLNAKQEMPEPCNRLGQNN